MSEQTIEAPRNSPASGAAGEDSPRRSPGALVRRYPWAIVAIVLLLFSLAFVRWANTRPGYDPYGWLVWGYQTLHLNLDLGGAPSWKPLTFLFTVPFALFGHYELWLWMVTAVALSLAGPIFAGRIVYRLVATAPERRRAAIVAAVFGGLSLLGIQNYMHIVLSVQSDPMIVSLCLGAVDCHLSGHPRWAFALGVLAALGRPESWPLLLAYSIFAWRRIPGMRPLIVGGLLLIPVMWFGIPTITNDRPLIASELAERSVRELHENKVLGTFHRFTALTYLPIQLLALGAAIAAYFRRNWTVLVLAGGAVAWMVVEIGFSLHGFSGVPRYMFEAAGMLSVLAGVALGWLLLDLPLAWRRIPRWVGPIAAALIVVSLLPGALSRARGEHKDLLHERVRTTVINRLAATVNALGGRQHVLACGRPVTNVEYVSALAWYTHRNVGTLGYRPKFELRLKHPIVLFTELPNGWEAMPWHTQASLVSSCANLKAAWIYTGHHPGGVLVPRT
jgi:hypothetical protein